MRPSIKACEARREGAPRRRWCGDWISFESHPFSRTEGRAHRDLRSALTDGNVRRVSTRPRGILFVDLDGTLVGADGIADRVWPALAALREAGFRIAVCTGRPGRGIALDVARRVDPDGLHVFESGAVVMHASGEVLVHHALPGRAVNDIVAAGVAAGATLECYSADARYLVRERNLLISDHERLLGFAAEVVAWPPVVPLVRMQWVLLHEEWPRLQAAAREVLNEVEAHEGHSPRMPGVSFVSMTAPGVSKATGVRVVLERLGIDRADAAMAGDNYNDIDAFGAVGTVFVPLDGVVEALALADYVIPSAAAGGVAEAAEILLARVGRPVLR